MPATSAVNRSKTDKLPTRYLLERREEIIIGYWRKMFSKLQNRFTQESSHFLGVPILTKENWEKSLFAALLESVEITAMQRGVERWEP